MVVEVGGGAVVVAPGAAHASIRMRLPVGGAAGGPLGVGRGVGASAGRLWGEGVPGGGMVGRWVCG